MQRLFVGLELSDPVRQALLAPRAGVEGARWQRDDQLHLTLAFIGMVDSHAHAEIVGELSRIPVAPFEMRLTGVGFFGKPGQPKALWAGVSDDGGLTRLHEKVCRALDRAGAPYEKRKFKPHVTLARFRRGAGARIGNWLNANEQLASPVETVQHFTLFSSTLTDEGSVYHTQARFGRAPGLDAEDETLEAAGEAMAAAFNR
ncbi:RNA 2',3'-cyclic phosphodiesterase [Yunchengibacter salinarum]|uniref:RNA 2',3'-cyclic phosphodiesterase n=1 Tax=Yunchengibacter salinarum TaxID=3133399 RepID=UPI0035B5B0ED